MIGCRQKPALDLESQPEQREEVVDVPETEKVFVPSEIKEIAEIKKIRLWLEYFYYNNLFEEELNAETGEISEDARMSFAASYIMQLEHEGLRFDTDTFRLYIPQKHMEEVVQRFFDQPIAKHHSLAKYGVLYEKDTYVIEAKAKEWPTRLDIISATQKSPNLYDVILNGNNTEVGEIDHQIKAEIEWLGDRYVLRKYQKITNKEAFFGGNPLDVGTSEEHTGDGQISDEPLPEQPDNDTPNENTTEEKNDTSK